jgi:hypothetical protein
MAPPGALFAFAYFTASATTFFAASNEIVFVFIICACVAVAINTIAANENMADIFVVFILLLIIYY